MSNALSYNNQDHQRHAILGAVTKLMNELQTLAPHPDRADYNGPLFINNNPYLKAANDHDGMLGSMMMETLLGAAFSEAASEALGSWAQGVEGFDATQAMECYSEYLTDIEKSTQKAAAHGQGTMARMAGKSIASAFNTRSQISPALQAFYDDMPRRMSVEKSLNYHAKQLAQLDAPAHRMDTQRPRFAA